MKKVICLLLAAFFQYMIYAQDKTADSLLKIIRDAKTDTAKVRLLYDLDSFYYYERYNPDTALLYAVQGLELSKKSGFKDGEIAGLIDISDLQFDNGKPDSAKQSLYAGLAILERYSPQHSELQVKLYRRLGYIYEESNLDSSIYYFTKSLQLAQNFQLPWHEARATAALGWEFILLGNYPQAMKLFIIAQKIYEIINDTVEMAFMYRQKGNVYFYQHDVRKSIHYYDTAESIGGKVRNSDPQGVLNSIYLPKARAYLELSILDTALLYGNLCYKISRKTYNSIVLSRILKILGDIYEKMGSDSIAIGYFREGISYSSKNNIITSLIETYNSLALYFFKKQNTDSCIFYARKAVELIQRSGALLDAPETYSILSNAYKASRNFDSTLKYSDLLQATKDSLVGKDKTEQMQFIVFDEEQQKLKQEAMELAYKNKFKFYSLSAGFALLFIVVGLLWNNTRIKQKSYVQLKKQQAETDHQRKTAEETLKKLQSTQSQLIQSEKMASLGELTAGIAHEIQNPLNFVNNFSEVNRELTDELEEEIDKGNYQQAKAIARNIKENEGKINLHGRRADTIVKGMLQHSRETKGQKELTDINTLADEYLRLSYQGLRARDRAFTATLRTDFDDTIGKINIIPQDIGRVLLNLCNNAFYAVAEKREKQVEGYEPSVSVSSKKMHDKIEIKVKDNGMGIPQKVLDKIFQPFFTTKPAGQGTGLGLSLSYDIIKAHEGEIKVETKEGEYTEFIIQLPIKTK